MAKKLRRTKEEITGVLAVLGGIFLALSLAGYSKWDPSLFAYSNTAVRNYGGIAGAYTADLVISMFGLIAYALPLFLLVYGIRKILATEGSAGHLLGVSLFLFTGSVMEALLSSTFHIRSEHTPGGWIGGFFGPAFFRYFSVLGAYILSLSGFLSSLILLSPISLFSLAGKKRGKAPQAKQKPLKKTLPEEEIIISDAEPCEADGDIIMEPVPDRQPSLPAPQRRTATRSGYLLPSVDLLTAYDASSVRPSKDELLTKKNLLEIKLADFDVQGSITSVEPGPVVTLYKFEPAPGVKINKVVSLSDDLALAIKAKSIRISPIAGENCIGIEVPNDRRELVSLREIVSSDSFQKHHSKLTIALGKDISGKPIITDLTRMPHLLVAGTTGAGKSVSINTMVMSILFKASPEEVKMLMIDPKMIELNIYDNIPHLISRVISNPKEASEALRKMVFEMERRYRLLAEKSARNIESFNAAAPDGEHMPYIVIFIDELADLMFSSSREVEDSITRLAQMARAAGMHLVIGTQRPSVDVITGIIKANLPSRISFKVSSKIDSRTILDAQGAEQLLEKGDMLLMLPGSAVRRVHGSLVTEEEARAVSDFIRSQGSPDYTLFDEIPLEPAKTTEEDGDDRDEMYVKAIEFADSVGEVSISSLQRRFKIGYNRAARMVEMMEDDGLIGPPKGAGKPRDFLRRMH